MNKLTTSYLHIDYSHKQHLYSSISPVGSLAQLGSMKYVIARKFGFKKKKFRITCDSKKLCTARVTPSKEFTGRYNIKLSRRINKYIGADYCVVKPDPTQSQNYLIYLKNKRTDIERLCGELKYQPCGYDNYLYTIIIDQKLYTVQSCDLKDRCLIITDLSNSNDSPTSDWLETKCQVNDIFLKLNRKYHLTINDKENQYTYLAITILLHLHECT